jgi:hypothetical protein
MKQIKIYALEGCGNCTSVTKEIEKLIVGKDINLVKKYCASTDSACDALEDGLNTQKYPIIMLNNFSYFNDKFNKGSGIIYICNNYNETFTPVNFTNDTVGIGVINHDGIIEKIKQIVL